MTVRPNYIPRTLIGVGGVRLYDIPGVTYPKEMLRSRVSAHPTDKRHVSRTIPDWGICTAEAAELLHCTPASARMLLHRRRIYSRLVETARGVQTLYWKRARVEEVARLRAAIIRRCPAHMVDAPQALRMLKVGRSTLYRYVHKHLLREKKLRMMTPNGTRMKTYYMRAEVAKLAARMRAIRAHERELMRLLQQRSLA